MKPRETSSSLDPGGLADCRKTSLRLMKCADVKIIHFHRPFPLALHVKFFHVHLVAKTRRNLKTITEMKITIEKEGRAWRWEITENGEHRAGGYGRTKADAENDAGIWREDVLAARARKAGLPVKGDAVTIKPEWMDAGDENYDFFAIETVIEGMSEVRVRATRKADGTHAIGIQSIMLDMLSTLQKSDR